MTPTRSDAAASQNKWTPAPWHVGEFGGNVTVLAPNDAGSEDIIIGVSHFGPKEWREANARLIAAAPELLEHLEYAVKLLTGIFGNGKAQVDAMRAALAKARGEQSK